MTQQRWFAILCGVLILAALAVSLVNVSSFARMFEPSEALAWAWAAYVDLALAGYTLAHVWLRRRGQRTNVVRFGFYWFVALSLVANVIVVLDRYDERRGAMLIDTFLNSEAFLFAACIAYGASIPISVLTFAHTIAEAFGELHACNPTVQLSAREKVKAARKPGATKRDVAKATGLSYSTVRKWWDA